MEHPWAEALLEPVWIDHDDLQLMAARVAEAGPIRWKTATSQCIHSRLEDESIPISPEKSAPTVVQPKPDAAL